MKGPLQPTPKPPERLGDRLENLEKEIRAWGRATKSDLIQRLISMDNQQRIRLDPKESELVQSIRTGLKKRQGDLDSVWLSFLKQGIYREHGVGKYRKVGSSGAQRAKLPWLAPVLPWAIDNLADIISDGYADLIALDLRLFVPGIIDSKISR